MRRLETEGTIPQSAFDEMFEDVEKVERFQKAQSMAVANPGQLKFDV